MKAFTWNGDLSVGLQVQDDQKLGQIVFLGEEGRGRKYQKVGLSRRNPAEVVNGCIINANPVKITLPAKDGKPELVFYVLEKSSTDSQAIIIRINSYGGYIRGGQGNWKAVAGNPETLVSGYGAFGDAGRIGNWDDGLVVMNPGDVIRIHPSRTWGNGDSAVWLDEAGNPQTASWQDWENLQALAKAEALIAKAATSVESLPLIYGQMTTATFQYGRLENGIKTVKGATGKVVALGESGRGRKLAELSLLGFETEIIEAAAIAKLSEEAIPARYNWEESKTKTIFGLTQSKTVESESFLVRINTGGAYTRRGDGSWEIWKGAPKEIVSGHGADGDAGRIGSWKDSLVVMSEGDVVFVSPSGDGPAYALFVQGCQLRSEAWIAWKVQDAKTDPDFYVAKGTAPLGYVPSEWLGRVVTIRVMGERSMRGGSYIPSLCDGETGELVSMNPLILNTGWDGRDRHDVTITSGLWVVLTDKKVKRLESDEADKRRLIRAEAKKLRNQASAAMKQTYFELTEVDLRNKVQDLAEEQGFDTMTTDGQYDSLTSWVERAKGIIEKFVTVESELKSLEQRQGSGEVLVDFGGHFRVMGATGNAQYWVIKPDGSEREPDEVSYRKRYASEGDKKWRLVGPEELAISWFKAYTASGHEFIVNKLPESGCTSEQFETIERLEREISERFYGATGMSGAASPEIGDGWFLNKQSDQKPKPVIEIIPENERKAPEAEDMAALLTKFGRK